MGQSRRGDAAEVHGVEGAGAGFEDAAMPAELLTTPGMAVATALASFERMRKPEAQSLQQLSYDTSRMMTTTSAPSVIYANRGNMPGGVQPRPTTARIG